MSIKQKFTDMKNKLKIEASKELAKQFKAIFKKYPDAQSFSFVAYTDYFNDGDECHFNVHEYYTGINGVEVGEMYNGKFDRRGEDEVDQLVANNPWAMDFWKDSWAVINDIPSDLIKDMFGDHIEVLIKRDGTISVESYTSHD